MMDEDLILAAAASSPHEEVCGYVFADGTTVKMENIAKHPDKYFMMDIEEQMAVATQFGMPVACWHSHPNGDPQPSDADRLYHGQAGLRMLIVADGRIHDHGIPAGS